MLMPSKVKYRKQQRGRWRGTALRGSDLSFGEYGLQAVEPGWLTARQIEAARVAIQRHVKRGGKLWIRVFPDKPITKKPAETRMGKGKGAPEGWVCVVKPARILFEMEGVDEKTARDAFRLAADKIGIKTRFVSRDVPGGGEVRTMKIDAMVEWSAGGAHGEGEGVDAGALHPAAPEGDGPAREPDEDPGAPEGHRPPEDARPHGCGPRRGAEGARGHEASRRDADGGRRRVGRERLRRRRRHGGSEGRKEGAPAKAEGQGEAGGARRRASKGGEEGSSEGRRQAASKAEKKGKGR